MEQTPELLNRVKKKILAMNKQLRASETENQKLRETVIARKEMAEKQAERIHALQSELETVKVAKAYSSEDRVDKGAKGKINEMVKEIDRCIALLND